MNDYLEKVRRLMEFVKKPSVRKELHNESERKPTTGNPADYIYRGVEKGQSYTAISNWSMPQEADEALHRWLHGRSHLESCGDFVEPAEKKFAEIMGFGPQDLVTLIEKC